MIETINPATNEVIEYYDLLTADEIQNILKQSEATFQEYRKTTFEYRKKLMLRAADLLEERKDKYAQTMTDEMGKTLKSSVAEVEKCAWVCRYYADNAEAFLGDEPVDTDASKSLICYRPMGAVLAVMPWNYPFW